MECDDQPLLVSTEYKTYFPVFTSIHKSCLFHLNVWNVLGFISGIEVSSQKKMESQARKYCYISDLFCSCEGRAMNINFHLKQNNIHNTYRLTVCFFRVVRKLQKKTRHSPISLALLNDSVSLLCSWSIVTHEEKVDRINKVQMCGLMIV